MDLKKKLFDFYRSTQVVSLCARFLSIKQEGTVTEYVRLFMSYSAPLPDLAEDVLENTFLLGLQPDIRAEVVSRTPIGLEDIMKQAQIVEDRNLTLKLYTEDISIGPKEGIKKGGHDYLAKNNNMAKKENHRFINLPDKGTGGRRDTTTPSRRLSEAEYQAKRAKGLCFRCDEKFTIGHRCKNRETRELRVLLVDGMEEI